jgi:phosphatidate cytidylyltransferase
VAFEMTVGSFALALLCVGPALAEALVLLRKGGSRVLLRAGLLLGVALIVARGGLELLDVAAPGPTRTALVFAPLAALLLAALLTGWGRFGPTLAAVLWVAGSLVFMVEIRLLPAPAGAIDTTIPYGMALLLVLVAAVKGGDSAAYAVGRSVGRIPMSPRISPRKTWEGAIAGLVVGTGLVPLLGLAFGLMPVLGCPRLLLLGAATNVAGQLGDLLESWAKRRAGVKDSGGYLGELGGALDVLDALLLAAPVGYFVARFLSAG